MYGILRAHKICVTTPRAFCYAEQGCCSDNIFNSSGREHIYQPVLPRGELVVLASACISDVHVASGMW